MVVIVWSLESVTVTTKVGEVYSIQHNLIPFVSDLRQAVLSSTTEVRVIVFNATFNNISLSYIVVVSFIGGGNRSAWRKPPTSRKSLTNFITQCCIEYTWLELDSNSQL
jgi:hypothetical protein